jgi:hypothetical protein
MEQSRPLWKDILRFSRHRSKFAAGLIMIGVLGLVMPVIPGLLLIGGAVFIIKPEWYHNFKRYFNR